MQPLWLVHHDGDRHRLKSNKPVVMVGSMRSATVIGSDGPANLYNGVPVSAHPGAKGRSMLLVLNDDVHYARERTKTNGTKLGTFRSLNRSKAAMTNAGRVYWYNPLVTKHTTGSQFSVGGMNQVPRTESF